MVSSPHSYACEFEISPRGVLRLLDEAVEQNHLVVDDCEKHPSNSLPQLDPNLPDIRLHFPNQGHAHRPAKLHRFDVVTNCLPIFRVQLAKPFANRFIPIFRPIEVKKSTRSTAASLHGTRIGEQLNCIKFGTIVNRNLACR